MLIVLSIFANGFLELRWSGASLQEWWRNKQFWVIAGVSSHFFAIFQGLFKVMLRSNTKSSTLTRTCDEDSAIEFYKFEYITSDPANNIDSHQLVGCCSYDIFCSCQWLWIF